MTLRSIFHLSNLYLYLPLTGAPSIISYLAIVSFSLNVLGPGKERNQNNYKEYCTVIFHVIIPHSLICLKHKQPLLSASLSLVKAAFEMWKMHVCKYWHVDVWQAHSVTWWSTGPGIFLALALTVTKRKKKKKILNLLNS